MTYGRWNSDGTLHYHHGEEGIASELNSAIGTTAPPIGSVMPWCKSTTGVPSLPVGWVECDGTVLADALSPYNGQTLPNLNGNAGGAAESDGQKYQRFLRGNTSSGASGGTETTDFAHTHTTTGDQFDNVGAGVTACVPLRPTTDSKLGVINHLPPYLEMVFIMRIR